MVIRDTVPLFDFPAVFVDDDILTRLRGVNVLVVYGQCS